MCCFDPGFASWWVASQVDPKSLYPGVDGAKLRGHKQPFGAHRDSEGEIDVYDGWISPEAPSATSLITFRRCPSLTL